MTCLGFKPHALSPLKTIKEIKRHPHRGRFVTILLYSLVFLSCKQEVREDKRAAPIDSTIKDPKADPLAPIKPQDPPKTEGLKTIDQTLAATPSTSANKAIQGVWVTHQAFEAMQGKDFSEFADSIVAAGFNVVYLSVYGGGIPKWDSKAFKAAGGMAEESPNLLSLVKELQGRGVSISAWFEYGLALYPKNHPIVGTHPDWIQRQRDGSVEGNETHVFMSPSHPKVKALLAEMVTELAELGIYNEIQLDRLRYTRASSKGREFGYEEVAQERFKQNFGKEPPADVNDSDWVTFREAEVNELVKHLYNTIKTADPNLLVSIAPVGHYGIRQHLQRWTDWLKGSYMDYVVIQVYNTATTAFQNHLDLHLAELETHGLIHQKARVAIGIRAKENNDAAQTVASIDYLQAKGFKNSVLWAYHFYEKSKVAIADDLEMLAGGEKSATSSWQKAPSHPFFQKLDWR